MPRPLLGQDRFDLAAGAGGHLANAGDLRWLHPAPVAAAAEHVPQLPQLVAEQVLLVALLGALPAAQAGHDVVHDLAVLGEERAAGGRQGVGLAAVLSRRADVAHVLEHLQGGVDGPWAGRVGAAEALAEGADDLVAVAGLLVQEIEHDVLEVALLEQALGRRLPAAPVTVPHVVLLTYYHDIS